MQKDSVFLCRPFLERETSKKPFVSLSFISCIITLICYVTVASLAQAIMALNGAAVNLLRRDIGSKQGRSIFLFGRFLYLFQNPKHLFKRTCCRSC